MCIQGCGAGLILHGGTTDSLSNLAFDGGGPPPGPPTTSTALRVRTDLSQVGVSARYAEVAAPASMTARRAVARETEGHLRDHIRRATASRPVSASGAGSQAAYGLPAGPAARIYRRTSRS